MKVFKISVSILAILTVSLLLFASYVATHPGFLFKKTILRPVISYLVPDLYVPWHHMELSAASLGWFRSRLSLKVYDGCFAYTDNRVCIDSLETEVNLHILQSPFVGLHKVDLKVFDQKIAIAKASDENDDEYAGLQSFINQAKSYGEYTRDIDLKRVEIDLKNIAIAYGEETYKITAQLNKRQFLSRVESKLFSLGLDAHNLRSLKDHIPFDFSFNQLEGAANSNRIQLKGQYFREKPQIDLDGSWLGAEGMKVSFVGSLNYSSSDMTEVIFSKIGIRQKRYPVQSKIEGCRFSVRKLGGDNLTFVCPQAQFVLDTKEVFKKYELERGLEKLLPQNFKLGFHVKANESELMGDTLPDRLLWMRIENFRSLSHFFSVRGSLEANIVGGSSEVGFLLNEVDFKFYTNQFKRIVDILKPTSYALPSPLQTMNGKISLQLNKTEKCQKVQCVSLKGKVNLKGPEEMRLDVDSDGVLQMNRKGDIDARKSKLSVFINKAWFYLPNLDPISGLPTLQKDRRIVKEEDLTPIEAPKVEMPLQIAVSTKNSNSIRLYYHLFDPYFSFGFSGQWGRGGDNWQLTTGDPVTISYLKRSVQVSALRLNKPKGVEVETSLNGLIEFESSGYNVDIKLVGSLEKPGTIFESDPSLEKEDIISLLLYNRTRENLTSFESENAGGTEAALKDRAVGLLGLWVFASTPIDTVAYNSVTNTYRVQVSLPGEIQLSLGSDWEKTQTVGLARHLTSGWFITTEYEMQDEENVGNVFLQKEFIY